MARAIQRFEVSLKAFVVDCDRALFVREADSGYWELPGGRIDVGEEWEPQGAVLARELLEELGSDFSVKLGTETVTWMRQRPTDGAFLFNLARIGYAVSGSPRLSDEHDQFAWFGLEDALQLRFPDNSNYREAIAELWAVAFPDVRPPGR